MITDAEANMDATDSILLACKEYVTELEKLAEEQAKMQEPTRKRWRRSLQHYYGIYPDETRSRMNKKKGGSRAFFNVTRPRTRTMDARLSDILLPTDTPNWGIKPTAVPELPQQTEREIVPEQAAPTDQQAAPTEQQQVPEQEPPTEEELEMEQKEAEVKEAKKRAEGMGKVMTDQLQECHFVEVERRTISQSCKLGTGVVKGPFAGHAEMSWQKKGEEWELVAIAPSDKMPAFESVDVWNFLPDMNSTSMVDCEFTFEIHRMNKRRLNHLLADPTFISSEINDLLEQKQPSQPAWHQYVRELREISQSGEQPVTDNRYYAFEYHGPIPVEKALMLALKGKDEDIMKAVAEMKEKGESRFVQGVVWFCEGRMLKFGISRLDSSEPIYSVFRIDPDELGIFGHGIPSMIDDSQGALNSAYRLTLDNGGLAGVPMFIIDDTLIEPADGDDRVIAPGKIWKRIKSASSSERGIAFEVVDIRINTEALERILQIVQNQVNEESSLPLISQGERSSKMTQTAHGMSLLTNAANVIFKNAARSFDNELLVPCLRRLYQWNMQFHPDDKIKGDMRIEARGSSVLLLRDLQAQNLLMLAQMSAANPVFQQIVKQPELFRKLAGALQIPKDDIIVSNREYEKLQKQLASQPSPEQMKHNMDMAKLEAQMVIAEMQFKAEILRQAGSEKTTVAQLAADLEKTQLTLRSSERMQALELASKERFGTGT